MMWLDGMFLVSMLVIAGIWWVYWRESKSQNPGMADSVAGAKKRLVSDLQVTYWDARTPRELAPVSWVLFANDGDNPAELHATSSGRRGLTARSISQSEDMVIL